MCIRDSAYTDLYGKVSFLSGDGSKVDFFGFSFSDGVNLEQLATLDWQSGGGGLNFKLIPNSSNLIISGTLAYSKYDIELKEADNCLLYTSSSGDWGSGEDTASIIIPWR